MKFFVLLSLCLGFLSACKPATPASQSEAGDSSTSAAVPAQNKQQAESKKSGTGQSLRQEVMDAVDYGTGAAQMRAKKSAIERIDKINEQHNKDLEEALRQ